MRRRGFLTSLLGLALTPAVAARVLAPAPTLLDFPWIYGRHWQTGAHGGFLVPVEFRDELLELLKTEGVVRDAR